MPGSLAAKANGVLQATLAGKLNMRLREDTDEEELARVGGHNQDRMVTGGLVGNRSLLSVGSACQMSEHSNLSSVSLATSREQPPLANRKSSGKEKKRKQKEAERVEKLRMLVSYLKSGTSQQLLSPLALEADELELAQRYKMRLILCEDCLQATESRHELPPSSSDNFLHNYNIRHTPSSMVDMHHFQHQHHQTMTNISSIANASNGNKRNFESTTFNKSPNMANSFMSASCRSVPLETSTTSANSILKDNLELNMQQCSFSENGADSGININVVDQPTQSEAAHRRDRMELVGSSPHIGAVSWVLRHSISDPGNNNFSSGSQNNNNSNFSSSLAAGASQTTPGREQSPTMNQVEESLLFSDSDLLVPRCANCRARRSFAGSCAPAYQHQQDRKLFYIDDLERKDSDSSDTNSQLAALSVAASHAESEKCANDRNNNLTPAQSKTISSQALPEMTAKSPPSPQPPYSSDQISTTTTTSTTTRSWSSEMVVFSSTPAAATPTTTTLDALNQTPSNNNSNQQSQASRLATSASSPRSCIDIHHNNNYNYNNHHQSISYNNINSSLANGIYPAAQQEIMGTNDNQNYIINNKQQFLQNQTVDAEQQPLSTATDAQEQSRNNQPEQQHQQQQPQQQQHQTSAWTNPQNLASWIDNEVNSLINDLEAKSQFISKEKQTKGSKRRWLSSVNRKGSSGALSN